jgi:hypothetical protein
MSTPAADDATPHEAPPRGLARLFVLIVLAEILSIAGLYWFGRAFA